MQCQFWGLYYEAGWTYPGGKTQTWASLDTQYYEVCIEVTLSFFCSSGKVGAKRPVTGGSSEYEYASQN